MKLARRWTICHLLSKQILRKFTLASLLNNSPLTVARVAEFVLYTWLSGYCTANCRRCACETYYSAHVGFIEMTRTHQIGTRHPSAICHSIWRQLVVWPMCARKILCHYLCSCVAYSIHRRVRRRRRRHWNHVCSRRRLSGGATHYANMHEIHPMSMPLYRNIWIASTINILHSTAVHKCCHYSRLWLDLKVFPVRVG